MKSALQRWLVMAVLSASGGIIFLLPFLQEVYCKPLLGGLLIDTFPGDTGYRYFFLFTSGICVVGFAAATLIGRRMRIIAAPVEPGSVRA